MKNYLSTFFLLILLSQASLGRERPNVVIIITDQQFADAMSCVMGDPFLHTPNMDRLAEKGVMFTRAYSPNPLCLPMRTSMMTGRFPHETGALNNGNNKIDISNEVFLGKIFKEAGYETGYFGKWHIPLDESLKDIHGFDEFIGNKVDQDSKPAAAFIKKKPDFHAALKNSCKSFIYKESIADLGVPRVKSAHVRLKETQ